MSSTPGHPRGRGSSLRPEASTGPDELQAGPVLRASRFPRWALVLAAVVLALALVAAAAYSAWRVNANKPQVVVTAGAPRTPWPLTPPLALGDYSRDPNVVATPTPNPATHKQSVTATYAKGGQNSVVLLLSRPETDLKKFMTDLGMNAVVADGDGFCGTSIDTNRDGCAVLRDGTAVLVVDLAGLTRTDLSALSRQFADTLAA